jgi:hypothetical protein
MATVTACANCHAQDLRTAGDRATLPREQRRPPNTAQPGPLAGAPGTAWRLERFYLDEPLAVAMWREFTVPWAPDERVPVSVGTDSNVALKTRKGTGLYKIPSLRGV